MASDYLEWVIREIEFYGRYHNHKETMAWTATAFYIPGIIVLGNLLKEINTCWHFLLVFLLFAAASCLVFFFVRFQFQRRWAAHYTVVGLMHVAARLSGGEQVDHKIEPGKRWPGPIEEEIESAKNSPQERLEDAKRKTEYTTYVAIFLATIIALVLVCKYCALF